MHLEAFNKYAHLYDEHFTNSFIGKVQRQQVYDYLKTLNFFSDKKVLEINCGTGEDAKTLSKFSSKVYATDISEQMIAIAKLKNKNNLIEFIPCSIQNIPTKYANANFDIIFSNFGGLNCLNANELREFSIQLPTYTNQKAELILIVMGTKCFLEKLYFILKFDIKKAWRRKQRHGTETILNEEIFKTYYYSPKQIKSIFKSNFKVIKIKPIALFVPPSYFESFIKKHPILFKLLVKLDSVFIRFNFLANYSDHYIIHLKRI